MPSAKKNTTDRGLGWEHQRVVERLLRKLIDGTHCWWCGQPMFRDKTRNWDRKTCAGDHSIPRAHLPGGKADRLLHGRCNSQRQDGRWDNQRPALTGVHPGDWRPNDCPTPGVQPATPSLAMDW